MKNKTLIMAIVIILILELFIIHIYIYNIISLEYKHYMKYSIPEIAGEIKDTCGYDTQCQANEIEKFLGTLEYKDKYTRMPVIFTRHLKPHDTLQKGSDCEGYAVLIASIARDLGMEPIHFMFSDNHVCVLAKGMLINCNSNETIRKVVPV